MLRVKYNQGNIQKRVTVALVLICLMVCAVDVQLYFEQRILANVATCKNKFDRRGSYFDMPLSELMNIVVISQSEGQPSSYLFDVRSYHSDLAPKPI